MTSLTDDEKGVLNSLQSVGFDEDTAIKLVKFLKSFKTLKADSANQEITPEQTKETIAALSTVVEVLSTLVENISKLFA